MQQARQWMVGLGAFVALSMAAPAFAQEAAEPSPLDAAELADVRDRLEASLKAARRAGLPEDLLLDKVREGLAKRVPPARIAGALEMLLGKLRDADRLVKRVPRHRDVGREVLVRTTTYALVAGADASELGGLVQLLVEREGKDAAPLVREGMAVVAELSERGIDGAAAARGARVAYQRHGRRGFTALLRAVRELGAKASPEDQARAVERAARRGPGGPGWDGHPHGGAKGHAKGKAR